MVNLYLDTSAIVKHYVDEPGSAWLRAQIVAADLPVSSQLLLVEVLSAFNRLVRESALTPAEYQRLRDIFREDSRTLFGIIPLQTAIVDSAGALLERHPLRSYDAIHLATALTAQQSFQQRGLTPLIFFSADDRLNDAASAEGLAVDNPNRHLQP
jgi:predicted nucleic acid-binding protein